MLDRFKEKIGIPMLLAVIFAPIALTVVACISYYSGKLEAREQAACAAHGGAYVKGECYVPSKQA